MSAYAKAIVAALIAGLSALATALPDGLTAVEVVTCLIAGLTALGAVWAVPNRPAPLDEPSA